MKEFIAITALVAPIVLCSCASTSMSPSNSYDISTGARALEPIKAQMGPPTQVQQQAQVIAVFLHALKEQIQNVPNAAPQSRATDVAAVEELESGMTAVATAQDQDGFDFALIRMCTDDRVATAQQLGPLSFKLRLNI